MAMRYVLLVMSFFWMSSVWSDVTVIYRKSDHVVASIVPPSQTVSTEIKNTINSELGGVESDYATVVVPQVTWDQNHTGKSISVDAANTVQFDDVPIVGKKSNLRSKLKSKLGLTDEELQLLVP